VIFEFFVLFGDIMRLSRYAKAVKSVSEVIDAELIAALRPQKGGRSGGPSASDIHKLSETLARKLLGSKDVAQAIGEAAADSPESEWVSTEQAAKLSGFSRPFIVAAIDSGVYPGEVSRSPKGHRRVLAGEFKQWMQRRKANPTNNASTVEELRSGVVYEPSVDQSDEADKAREKMRRDSTSECGRCSRPASTCVATRD
jgi:hypothetical protein